MKETTTKRELIKGVIAGSIMATTDIMVYQALHPIYTSDGKAYRFKMHMINNIEGHIAGLSVGYVIGKRVAEEVVDGFDAAVAAYKGEEIVDG